VNPFLIVNIITKGGKKMTAGMITQFNPISDVKPIVTPNTSDSGNNFLEVFKASADKNSEKVEKQPEMIKSKKSEKTDDNSQDYVTNDFEGKATADETKPEEKQENSQDELKAIEEAGENVVCAIAQILDVEPEVVTEALESIGLEEVDLLDTTNVPQVVVQITGTEDVVDIMTDESLFADVKDIVDAVQEVAVNLADELNTDVQGVKDVAKDIISEADNAAEIEIAPEVVAMEETKEDTSKDSDMAGNQMNFQESFIEHVKAAAQSDTEAPIAEYVTDMNEIYNQVSESLKVNMTEEVTEMEMNLHPASLGNVKVQIAERDGVITANFTTQNEQVKAALETQILELKENMNEQGIKVESIEVTLASHAFEENLSKEGEHTSSEGETKKKRRSINLNEIEETDDINIEDDIRIAREMMMHNGTTVDYMA